MCGRYTLGRAKMVRFRFGLPALEEDGFSARFNVAPSQLVPVVVSEAGVRRPRLMRWGFQPRWVRSPRQPPPINARAETLAEGRLFRSALVSQRCLIPADGFYEWVQLPGRAKRQPIHFRLREDDLFAFAGLYAEAEDGMPTCAIITTAANDLLAQYHHRMPVILDPADEALWLDPSVTDLPTLLGCLRAYPSERMAAYPVSGLVSSVRNDGPALVEPLLSEPSPADALPEQQRLL